MVLREDGRDVCAEFGVIELVGIEAIWETCGSRLRGRESGSEGSSGSGSCCVAIEQALSRQAVE